LQRFQELVKGSHASTMLIAPFDLLAMNQGHTRLARADEHLGAYQGVIGAARRSWARENEAALLGYIRAYHAGVQFVVDPKNRDIVEALLIALAGRTMTPPLARQAADTLLDPKSGFIRDLAVNFEGARTVLALRSKFTGKPLGDPTKYIDSSYRDKALAR
jgi:ABC-type nitrate/sulfonate/bicarbonate transport system substrate-binding protein